MIDKVTLFVTLNTIGEAVLVETLKEAAYYVSHSNGHCSRRLLDQTRSSYVFITGTGLDLIIDYYHLGYDPGLLRTQFFWMLGRNTL